MEWKEPQENQTNAPDYDYFATDIIRIIGPKKKMITNILNSSVSYYITTVQPADDA